MPAHAQLSDVKPEDINPSLFPVIIQGHRDGLLLGGDFRIPVKSLRLASEARTDLRVDQLGFVRCWIMQI